MAAPAAVLETSYGLVFEDREEDLMCATYEENRHSVTGPTWTVRQMDYLYFEDEMAKPVYAAYATAAGREWWRKHRR